MRSLFYYTGRGWTGEARAFAIAARGLAARGEPVTIVCRPDGDAELGFAHEELEVITLPVTDSVSRDAWRLRTVLKEKFTEVVFLHTEREQLVASSAMRLASRGAIVRRIPTGGAVTNGRGARLAARLAGVRLLFTTEEERRRAGTETDGYIAPLGVDLERLDAERAASRSTLGVEPGTKLMVCVADTRARSRITTALRTVGLLAERHPGLRLALVGSGSDDDDVHMHAAALGVTQLVRFLGQRDDMAAVLAAAEVGWVAADGDDGAFGCLDFMAAGVPVIAERSPYLAHYVPDGIAGVLLPRADPADTAAAVAKFLAEDNQREAMGRAGRNRVAREFTVNAMVDGFAAAASEAGDRSSWTTR
jgi:glycosyltransferase involved in cell wall biosynthesis